MSSLAPVLLVSMPQLVDRNFNRAVILLCKHNDEGAFGLIVNRPLVTTGRVVVNVQTADAPAQPALTLSSDRELQVWIGGPVEPQRSWILVSGPAEEAAAFSGKRIGEGLYLSTSPDLLRRLLEPEQFQRVKHHLPSYMQGIAAFAFITGWRTPSEILPLEWRQVDLKAGEVRLDAGTTKNGRRARFR